MTQQEIISELRDIEGELSPENLHCDGEISYGQAMKKRAELIRKQQRLIKLLGREPTFEELYGRY